MKTDVAIVGGGPGGSTCAMFLTSHGIHSTIIEKSRFPRFQIGESLTGECGAIVRALGLEERMLRDGHLSKNGLRVYGRQAKSSWYVPVKSRSAQGELCDTFTWQVRRSSFDKMMLDTALERGTTLMQGTATGVIRGGEGEVTGVNVRMPDGRVQDIEAKVVVDASGYSAFLHKVGATGRKTPGKYSKQVAIFSQVTGAIRDSGKNSNDTLIFYKKKNHWAWFIPLDQDTVSVGVVFPADYLQSKEGDQREFLLRELHEISPELKRRLPEINLVEKVRARSNYSFHIREFTGKNFLCVGDSHRFIDPVFSFGLYVSMKEAQLAAAAIKKQFQGTRRVALNPFIRYQKYCDSTLDTIQDVVDGFWNHPLGFGYLAHYRYPEEFIDILAGRVYREKNEPLSAGLFSF